MGRRGARVVIRPWLPHERPRLVGLLVALAVAPAAAAAALRSPAYSVGGLGWTTLLAVGLLRSRLVLDERGLLVASWLWPPVRVRWADVEGAGVASVAGLVFRRRVSDEAVIRLRPGARRRDRIVMTWLLAGSSSERRQTPRALAIAEVNARAASRRSDRRGGTGAGAGAGSPPTE